jgi:ferredoxin
VGCGQCQVVVPDPWYEKVKNKITENEETRLMRTNNFQAANVRLACCIQVRPELNEMILVIGNNRSGDGDWFGG